MDKVLALIPSSLKTYRRLGIIVDANGQAARRWNQVIGRLRSSGCAPPKTLPAEGWVGTSATGVRVGVWLMPDNATDGALEAFLLRLVPEDDLLMQHARDATEHARKLDPRFGESDRSKAELHTWLAWQNEPGRPYGTAIGAGYMRHDSLTALAFVQWMKRVFGDEPSVEAGRP